MADMSSAPIGRKLPAHAEMGASMHGVTGKEAVFSAGADTESSYHGGGEVPCDLKGRPFTLKVDAMHKSKELKLLSLARPHMVSFYVSTFSFFTAFLSTFAPAALGTVIRDNLNLTGEELATAGITAVCGTIGARILMGQVCDLVGPRFGHAFLLLLTAPAVFFTAIIDNATSYIFMRFLIGLSLATFVANQFWASQMFSPNVVGLANATSAGWGNLGGGITQFLSSALYIALLTSYSPFQSWRRVFFILGCFHVVGGLLVLVLGQDTPDANYADLRAAGHMRKLNAQDATRVFYAGVLNYRTWILTLNYAFCFGVELTLNNIITPYMADQFGLSQVVAGTVGGMFGFMNIVCRSVGGLASDVIGKKTGMRGRIWVLWVLQTLEGVACIAMGLAYKSLALTIVLMLVFSFFVQASEGATYGIVPFVSRRALGIVSGFVGAGGNAGAVINQRLWFFGDKYATYEGLQYMGYLIIGVTATLAFVHFPMWGSMFVGGSVEHREEDYYLKDYTEEEVADGYAVDAIKFADLSRDMRGRKGLEDYENSVHGGSVNNKA